MTERNEELRLADVVGNLRTYPFILGAAKIARKDEKGMEVVIEENSPVFVNAEDRKRISDPNGSYADQGYRRWSAGGSLNMYRQPDREGMIIPLFLKDSGAPSYAGHVALPSGLSDDFGHWYDLPSLAIKEGFEETAVIVNGESVLFDFGRDFESLLGNINNVHKCRLLKQGIAFSGTCTGSIQDSYVTNQTMDITVELIGGGTRQYSYDGIVNEDPATMGIDYLKVYRVDVPEGEVMFVDCETSSRGFLDREILLFSSDSFELSRDKKKIRGAYALCQSGKKQPADPTQWYPMVPVLHECMNYVETWRKVGILGREAK